MTTRKMPLFLTSALISIYTYSQHPHSFKKIEQLIEGRIPIENRNSAKGWKYQHRWLDEFKKRVSPSGEFYQESLVFTELERLASKKPENMQKTSGWIPVGPSQRANSSLTKGMGRINCITFHPTDSNIFWVGVAQGGIWKTTDNGQHWTPLGDDLPVMRISDIAVDPNNTDVIYLCIGDYGYMDIALNLDDRKRHTHYGLGVYKTTNGGVTWSPTSLTYQLTDLDGSLMRRVFINPNHSDSILAAGIGGVWSSSDGGANWTRRNDSLIWDIEADPNNPMVLYATTGYLGNSQIGSPNIMKSVDFGLTWTTLNTGIPPTQVQRIEVAVAPTNSNHVYALTCGVSGGFYRIYSSLDGGVNWTSSNNGGRNILGWFDGTYSADGQGTYDLSLLVDPFDENKIYTGGINIWGSSDGGITFDGVSLWYEAHGTGLHADQHQFKYNPLDGKIYVCNDGGLVRTDQIIIGSWSDANNLPGYTWPTTWEYISDGMQTSSFYRVAVSEGNSGNFSAGAQDNSTYFLNGGNWSNLFSGDGMNTLLHPVDSDVIYGSSQYGRILYSNNGGLTHTEMHEPVLERGEWTTPFMFAPDNPNLVYAGFGNLYTATPGTNFTTILSGFNPMTGVQFSAPASTFNISQSDPSTIYLAKRIYHSYNQLSELWVTMDHGVTWTNRTLGLPDSLYFTGIDIDDDNPLFAWVTVAGFESGKHVYRTFNGGNTWINVTYDLPNLPVNSIVHRDSSLYNTIYIGTDLGVYYSNDTLNSWLPFSTNLPNVIVSDLKIHYTDRKIYAATFGRGVWKSDILMDSILNVGIKSEINFDDVQVLLYPNPNKGSFTLTIEGLEKGKNLNMDIVDIMGKVIVSRKLTLSDASQSFILDYNLPAGLYFVNLTNNNSSLVKKFLVD